MADKRKPGYCAYCQSRVWATRRNHFMTKWHCAQCGSLVEYVGEAEATYAAALARQARMEQTIRRDPTATMGGAPVNSLPGPDPTVHTGLINRAFGWMIRD